MYVITRKTSTQRWFRPGYNVAMGKEYHQVSDLLKDMKAKGLEPTKAHAEQKPKPKYKPTKWANDMHAHVKEKTKNGKAYVSDRFRDELKKKKVHLDCFGKKMDMGGIKTDSGGFN